MKKTTIRLVCAISMLLLIMSVLSACSNTEKDDTLQQTQGQQEQAITVTELTVKTMPTKTDYLLGEAFSADGCVLTATFSDGATKDVAVGEPGVEVSAPSTDSAGTKNVAVKYEGKRATFQVSVIKETLTVTLSHNTEDIADETVTVVKGEKLVLPEETTREGYSFAGWFTDAQRTIAYNFDSSVEQPITLYALWLSKAAANYEFIFDLNQADLKQRTIVQQVQEGKSAIPLSEDPERVGYAFAGWFSQSEGGDEYDFSTPVTASISVYAHWDRTAAGEQTYLFEAEDTSLTGKSGPAFSGTAMESGMIIYDTKHGASNDRFVGYLYQRYNSLEFFINADEAADNVILVARLSAEMRNFTFNKSNFSISVNGVSLDYGDIAFTNVPSNSYNSIECLPFEDYIISTTVSLKKGMNLISFMTENDEKMEGSTLLAAAPLVDCIKLTSTAVLTWCESMGLPASNY